jgi:hypothetical protein
VAESGTRRCVSRRPPLHLYHGDVRCLLLAPVALACGACSLVAVERRPPLAEATTPSDCTDSYEMPMLDAAVAAALVGYSVYTAKRIDEDCESGRECDPQSVGAVIAPVFYAIPFAISALWGTRQIGRCRDLHRWQLDQAFPVTAGEVGQRCIPVDGGRGRCTRSTCVDDVCVDCATPIAALEAAGDQVERRRRFHAMPAGCREVLASTCGALSLGAVQGRPTPASCTFFHASIGVAR